MRRRALLDSSLNANGHEYVEIGGLKWATMPVGNYNEVCQWGDNVSYTLSQTGNTKSYVESDYKFYNNGYTKYNSTDGKIVLDLEDDLAKAKWGGDWRTPTLEEFTQLLFYDTVYLTAEGTLNTSSNKLVWLSSSNRTGMYLADKNDYSKRIFFGSTAGIMMGNQPFQIDGTQQSYGGAFWTRSLSIQEPMEPYFAGFSGQGDGGSLTNFITMSLGDHIKRYHGMTVWPILSKY